MLTVAYLILAWLVFSITGVLNMACSRVTNHRGLAFRSLAFFCSRLGRYPDEVYFPIMLAYLFVRIAAVSCFILLAAVLLGQSALCLRLLRLCISNCMHGKGGQGDEGWILETERSNEK